MVTETMAASVRAAQAALSRLVAPAVAREALARYDWPLATRVAGYIAAVAGLFSTIVALGISDPRRVVATLVYGGLFVAAFHFLSRCQFRMPPYRRATFFILQVGSATIIQWLCGSRYDMGALILFFVIACEAQFLASFRLALGATALLWLWAVVTMEVTRAQAVTLMDVLSDSGTMLAGFVFVAAFTHSAVTELIQRHQASILLAELNEAHAQLQQYVTQVEELAVARERNRMAREIHDTLGHYLTVINVQIETAQKLGTRNLARSQEALATAKRLASECLAEVRRSVAALRPTALDDVTLPEAIGLLIDEFRQTGEIAIHVEVHETGSMPPAVEEVAYRVIQEALTNVHKHAGARNVWLRLEGAPSHISASVRDDGRGADADLSHHGGYGLTGMRERVEALGGRLEVHTAPGAGFRIAFQVPYTFPGPAAAADYALAVQAGV